MKLFDEEVGDGEPLSATYLSAYGKDYEKLFNLTKHSTLLVIPAFTPEHAPCGKAIILTADKSEMVAKASSNGTLIIHNLEVFEQHCVVNRIDPAISQMCFTNLMQFFKNIGVLKSYKKFQLDEFLLSSKLNYGFTASRDPEFFMDEMIGNTCTSNEIHVSRQINIGDKAFFEQVTFNFYKSFKISIQYYRGSIRFDFFLKEFKAYAVVTGNDNNMMVDVFKKMVKIKLEKMSIYLDDDYLFTDEFFEYYKQITAMIDI
jgi:hypothetical protein